MIRLICSHYEHTHYLKTLFKLVKNWQIDWKLIDTFEVSNLRKIFFFWWSWYTNPKLFFPSLKSSMININNRVYTVCWYSEFSWISACVIQNKFVKNMTRISTDRCAEMKFFESMRAKRVGEQLNVNRFRVKREIAQVFCESPGSRRFRQ